ncbi:MAG: hypothetical protein JWM86_2658 [Thermoleophilia bacterium]|nr:hypothetical protein [Thermoleophilia bacterium]
MHAHAAAADRPIPFDGDVDPGIEQFNDGAAVAPTTGSGGDLGAEAVAHALLRLVAEHPGQMGRLRAARVVGGYPVPHRDGHEQFDAAAFAVEVGWPLREFTRLVDALISGRLVAQTAGPRPVLVLTRAGFRTLEALEGGSVRTP